MAKHKTLSTLGALFDSLEAEIARLETKNLSLIDQVSKIWTHNILLQRIIKQLREENKKLGTLQSKRSDFWSKYPSE